jgi:hypothetical protein
MTMLLPFISEQLNGMIWRIEVDELSDTLYLEIRNDTDKKVSFTAIDLISGKVNFTDLTTPERWLTGIEASYDGMLLLHNYQSENSPVHKGVIAIDNQGENTWSNYTYAFDHLSVNGPILFNTQIQPKKLFLIDVKTGATIRAYEPVIDTEAINSITVPQAAPSSYLQGYLDIEPHGNIIHYLEHNNFRIVSLHTHLGGQLKQLLYIWDSSDLVYEDLLHAGIQKMQPESFILYKNSLIYIKNKSELKVFNL